MRGDQGMVGQEARREAIYVRSATADQCDDGARLEQQVEVCRQLAESLGADVPAEYRDIGAGTSWNLA